MRLVMFDESSSILMAAAQIHFLDSRLGHAVECATNRLEHDRSAAPLAHSDVLALLKMENPPEAVERLLHRHRQWLRILAVKVEGDTSGRLGVPTSRIVRGTVALMFEGCEQVLEYQLEVTVPSHAGYTHHAAGNTYTHLGHFRIKELDYRVFYYTEWEHGRKWHSRLAKSVTRLFSWRRRELAPAVR